MQPFAQQLSIHQQRPWSLYLHIPFCRYICPYCDFAKTARYDNTQVDAYLTLLKQQFLLWVEVLSKGENAGGIKFKSLFLGGGTPGLFGKEYEDLLAVMRPYFTEDAELSLECNPEDVNSEKVSAWKDLGFNRVSMGVQSFDAHGLSFLGRRHSSEGARQAIEVLGHYFDNLNIDLIYGWPGQSVESLQADLDWVEHFSQLSHLSAYHLTYESSTPMGRAAQGAKFQSLSDDCSHELYQTLVRWGDQRGWNQDEVSNWSRPGFECVHNASYWQQNLYLALGAGAHGLLAAPSGQLMRAEHSKHWLKFMRPLAGGGFGEWLRGLMDESMTRQFKEECGWEQALSLLPVTKEQLRDELIASSLRTQKGVAYPLIEDELGFAFVPSPSLRYGLDQGILQRVDGHLRLQPDQWFLEQAWAVELSRSYQN